MIRFECGDEPTVRGALDVFIARMDRLGEAYGYTGTTVLSGEHGVLATSEDRLVLLVVGGAATIISGSSRPITVTAGHAVCIEPGEPWRLRWPVEGELRIIQAHGPALRVDDFATAR